MSKLTFCTVPNEEGTTFYNIKAEWFDPEFSISILENASAWKGLVNSREIEQFSKEHNISAEEYIKECQVAFSSDGPEKFVYSIKNQHVVEEETVSVLTWKKIVDSDIKLKYGSIYLQPEPLHCFINEVWNVLDSLSVEAVYAKKVLEEVECEKEMLFGRLKEYQELKLEMEKTLYAKFLLILNAKKEKIEKLEAQLAEYKCSDRIGVNTTVDDVKIEPVEGELGTNMTVSKSRKNAYENRGRGRTRGRPPARRKDVEVISPLDILPPSQREQNLDLSHAKKNHDPAYDSDTEVDEPEPARPSTSRWNTGSGRVFSEVEVKEELPERGTGSETKENVASFTNDMKPEGMVVNTIKLENTRERKESGSSTDIDYSLAQVTRQRRDSGSSTDIEDSLARATQQMRESGSSTDVDDFLAQKDELPLSMMPKRSKRSAYPSRSVPTTSRDVCPLATKTDVSVFNTQELLDDM